MNTIEVSLNAPRLKWTTRAKVDEVCRRAQCGRDIAIAYLLAEEGDVDDAAISLEADLVNARA